MSLKVTLPGAMGHYRAACLSIDNSPTADNAPPIYMTLTSLEIYLFGSLTDIGLASGTTPVAAEKRWKLAASDEINEKCIPANKTALDFSR